MCIDWWDLILGGGWGILYVFVGDLGWFEGSMGMCVEEVV